MSLKILIDTTYILPALGVEIDIDNAVFEKLRELLKVGKIECYYTPFNVLESLWKISKTTYDGKTLLTGLESVEKWFKLIVPEAKDYVDALSLKSENFKDLIDLILYVTARNRNLKFLTRDKKLAEYLESIGEDLQVLINENELP